MVTLFSVVALFLLSCANGVVDMADLFSESSVDGVDLQIDRPLVYIYRWHELPAQAGTVLNMTQGGLSDRGDPMFKGYGDYYLPIANDGNSDTGLHIIGELQASGSTTDDPAKADVFYVPWLSGMTNGALQMADSETKERIGNQEEANDVMLEWIKKQKYFPTKPHFYHYMMCGRPWASQPNLYQLTIEGSSECWGCQLQCGGSGPPKVDNMRRGAMVYEVEDTRLFKDFGLDKMVGIEKTDIILPYMPNPFLHKQTTEYVTKHERRMDMFFKGSMTRDFVGWMGTSA
jgi:hypothetical protein